MVSLKADNRALTTNAKYSYLSTNYLSNVGSIVLTNSLGFATNDYILLGEFGAETSEIIKVSNVTAATHALTLASNTKFSHAESTKITILKYNQVKFYQTAAATFSNSENPLPTGAAAAQDIQADSIFTVLQDTTNTTGYGWFLFYNETTAAASSYSNAIPYGDFAVNSVKEILDNFFSLLNNKEIKLITNKDAFRWLNEAYSIALNELNLINETYKVEDTEDITTSATTQEYDLPAGFSKLISVWDDEVKKIVEKIDIKDVSYWDNSSGNTKKYYIRAGAYIGFSPVPSDTRTIKVKYKSKATALDSYYDNIVLPDNNFYFLVNFMMFRAAPKLQRRDADTFYKTFMVGINRMKVVSHKQDAGLDSWGISSGANI